MCIHPEIAQPDAEVWVTCPVCYNEGSAEDTCRTCDDTGRVTVAEEQAAFDAGIADPCMRSAEWWRRRREQDAAEQAAMPALTPADARLALETKLRCAESVQADFDRRGVSHRWPVTLTIEEARALLAARDAA